LIVLDTGGLFAYLDEGDQRHDAVSRVIESDAGPFIMSPFVLAELDYLVQTRMGVQKECRLLEDVDEGVYELIAFGSADMNMATMLVKRYADLGIGLADASVAVVASRFRCLDVLTLDERHFRTIRPLRGGDAFRLLPADAA
jgi:predicted nucleic acid-binding protein